MNHPIAYVGGRFLPEGGAVLSVLDHAILYGDAVFRTAFAWRVRSCKLDAYIERGFRSITAVGKSRPVSLSKQSVVSSCRTPI